MAANDRSQSRPANGTASLAFLSYGFRPFFLAAAVFAALAAPLWLLLYAGNLGLPAALPASLWHGHEMLFGYGGAVLAGFLLTATPGWSQRQPVHGWSLAALAGLWLAGRLAIAFGGTLPGLAAAIDLAFLPALAVAIAPALEGAARRNLVFLAILGVLFVANLAVHLHAGDFALGTLGLRLALDTLAVLIGLVGGRIIPSFTANALKARGQSADVRGFGMRDRLALGSLVAVLLVDPLASPSVAGIVSLIAAALNLARMSGWQTRHTLGEPILWVLHLGYLWLGIGLAWKGLVELTGFAPAADAAHGLALGAIGSMTLGVMSRAALGHTGRPLAVGRAITAAYLAISAAAIARLGANLVPGGWHLGCLWLSALLWSLAFIVYAVVYVPILIGPRVDQPR